MAWFSGLFFLFGFLWCTQLILLSRDASGGSHSEGGKEGTRSPLRVMYRITCEEKRLS